MHIAIDASRCTTARVTGTERYALELIRALIRLNSDHRITLYFRDAPAPDLFPASPLVTQKIIPFRRAWTHLRFAAALWGDRPAVTFVPAHTLPFAFPGAAVVTAHDLGYKHFPEAHPFSQRAYLDLTTRYSARRARLILADSQATADDLTRFYGTSAAKIRVVYPGLEEDKPPRRQVGTESEFHEGQAITAIEHSESWRLGGSNAYFLYLGTLQPRKNIARLVEAYQLWRSTWTGQAIDLVLAGGKGWLYDPAWAEGKDGVRLLGYVEDADKPALYAGALAFVLPSLFEGFGFPVLEAMQHGAPVIASNTSSLPEVVGAAGLLVDPLNVAAIAAALGDMASDAALRARLRTAGYAQAARFTWAQAARQTLIALEEAGAGA